jgi:rod shape-determining protein MreD
MFKKLLLVVLLFYLFALMQNSFLIHFNLFGVSPNLVFILYFLFVFFSKEHLESFIYAIIAGTLLDLFWYNYLGPSIIFLIFIAFLLKKTQSLLSYGEDNYPFIYFFPIFLIYFCIYKVAFMVYLQFIDPAYASVVFNLGFIFELLYNLLFASIGYWILKKIKNAKRI